MIKLKYTADIKNWIAKAEEDTKWARNSLKGKFYSQTCFIAQQIAEKALKAYLLSQEKIPPKTHSLPQLLDFCLRSNKGFAGFRGGAEILDKYYAPTRYPDINFLEGFTQEKAQEALDIALKIFDFINERLGAIDNPSP